MTLPPGVVRADDEDAKVRRERRLIGVSLGCAMVLLTFVMLGIAVAGTWGKAQPPEQVQPGEEQVQPGDR